MTEIADRPVTLTFVPTKDGWAVRLDEFSLAGVGATEEEALDSLAESLRDYGARGALEQTVPVSARELEKEKSMFGLAWRLRKRRPRTETARLHDLLARGA